jgi:hypothetical protein
LCARLAAPWPLTQSGVFPCSGRVLVCLQWRRRAPAAPPPHVLQRGSSSFSLQIRFFFSAPYSVRIFTVSSVSSVSYRILPYPTGTLYRVPYSTVFLRISLYSQHTAGNFSRHLYPSVFCPYFDVFQGYGVILQELEVKNSFVATDDEEEKEEAPAAAADASPSKETRAGRQIKPPHT